ncbi:MAG: glycosyltransferase family 2 protein [Armatimonadota bacterium]
MAVKSTDQPTITPAPLGAKRPRPRLALSVVIPAFNERDTIRETLARLRALDVDLELIVVDDCSTDGTRELLRDEPGLVLIEHETNQGKGAAIRSALARVTGDVVAIQDADLEYDPQDLLRLMEPIERGEVKVVYGSRFLAGRPPMEWPNYVCNRLLAWSANLLYGACLTDEATCYKVFEAKLLRSIPLECRRFEFCPEVTAKVLKRGEPIAEMPISYSPRSYDSGKKIRWWDGVEALWTLLKYRFKS